MQNIYPDSVRQILTYLKTGALQAGLGRLKWRDVFTLVYLADRYHLRRNGCSLTRNRCFPTKNNPKYVMVLKDLPPINIEFAREFGFHPENPAKFKIELDLKPTA